MRGLALALVLLLATACAARMGPGPEGWVYYSFWQGFNIDVDAFGAKVCLGCLEAPADAELQTLQPVTVPVEQEADADEGNADEQEREIQPGGVPVTHWLTFADRA